MYKVDCKAYLTTKGKPKGKIDCIAWLLLNVFGCKFCETCKDNPCESSGECCTDRIANYIREAVKEELIEKAVRSDAYDALEIIDTAPSAVVKEIKHGYWIDKPTGRYCHIGSYCSVCQEKSGIGGIESNRHKPYCPNCGAKMDGTPQKEG